MTSFLIIAAFVGGVYFGWWLKEHQPNEKKEEPQKEYNMDMARQWANIMSYDGTERGQIEYGEEDDDT